MPGIGSHSVTFLLHAKHIIGTPADKRLDFRLTRRVEYTFIGVERQGLGGDQMKLQDGQCGLCAHFGEHGNKHSDLVQIRQKKEVPPDYKEECGHPSHAPLHLMVTATSGCSGFVPAQS